MDMTGVQEVGEKKEWRERKEEVCQKRKRRKK
jgi:hypothetical protein